MNVVEFLQAINGLGQMRAADGQFLGVLSSNQYDPNSICNPNGSYGSFYSFTSIRNPNGIYGSTFGLHSPYNPNCLNPPAIFYQNQKVLIVTRNPYAMTNGIQVIDPNLLFVAYSSNALAALDPLTIYTRMYRDSANFVASLSQSIGYGLPMDNRNLQ